MNDQHEIIVSDQTALQEVDRYNQIIDMALTKGELERIEKWMMLKREYEKDEARKAFYLDLAEFHRVKPILKKDMYNKWFDSWYTSLGNLLGTYTPILGQYGLSLSLNPKIVEGKMVVTAVLSHRLGHRELVEMPPIPIDEAAVGKQSGQKSRNAIQDIRSTFTYTRAMAIEAVLGVAGTEGTIDDDGNSASKKPNTINEEQAKELREIIKDRDVDVKKWLEFIEYDSIENIPSEYFEAAKTGLLKKKKTSEREPGQEG